MRDSSHKQQKDMKRLHVSLGVKNLEESVQFYNALFNAEPEVLKSDYAKWSLKLIAFGISLFTQYW